MTETTRALVVDDEERIRYFLKKTLERSNYVVTTASNGKEALSILRDTGFDVAIVDLSLDGHIDGLQILEAIRWRWPATAVIILTAHGSLESAMTAIREGIDDYLLKPVKPERIRQATQEALERRKSLREDKEDQHVLQTGAFFADLEQHLATRDGETLDLTPQEFKLLVHLMQNSPRVLAPPDLVRVVRGYAPRDLHKARQTIKWYIHRLRQQVEPDPSTPRHILNVRGVGYKLET